MRLLIAFEESHRSYGQTMAGAIRKLRPGAEVALVRAEGLAAEVARFDPHMLLCNRPNEVDPGGGAAGARLSDDPEEPSEFCVGGRRKRLENPDFGELLGALDEAEERVRNGRELRGC